MRDVYSIEGCCIFAIPVERYLAKLSLLKVCIQEKEISLKQKL